MSNDDTHTGTIGWVDLTVENAEEIRDFYADVVGWKHDPVDMKGYHDFCMIPSKSDNPVAGICHARGDNADLPAQWLIYVTVTNLDRSMQQCEKLGGSILSGPRSAGPHGRFCVIKDPSGAVTGLYEKLG